jgi:hypothetical protein
MTDTVNTYNMTVKQGSTFNRVITWYQVDGITPVDLTGYTARSYFKRKISDSTNQFELSTSNGRISLGEALGTITINIAAVDTDGLNGLYVYDLELISGSYVDRILQGVITIDPQVTK